MWRWMGCWGLLAAAWLAGVAQAPAGVAQAPAAQPKDWVEWGNYRAEHPEMGWLEPTGPDLPWTTAETHGAMRLFVSNHPEGIGRPLDPQQPETTRWPAANQEGKLWSDDAEGMDGIKYRMFLYHQNWFPQPIYVGIVVENLSTDTPFVLTGEQVSMLLGETETTPLGWDNLTTIGKRNAYAELSNRLYKPLPTLTVPAATPQGPREVRLYAWKLGKGSTFGARLRLFLYKLAGTPGPARCRISTVWAWTEDGLTRNLPLIPTNGPHVRGSWPTSEVLLSNERAPFDVGARERGAEAVRWLRLCQPAIAEDGAKSYGNDVPYVASTSYNPEQARTNNGMYGVRSSLRLVVVNTSAREERVGVYLRYPNRRLPGVYVGAASTYWPGATGWLLDETRAIELANWTYTDRATGRETFRDWRWATKPLGTYPVDPGGRISIPLALTHDGPAMLPLAIVLRKEVAAPPPPRVPRPSRPD